MTDKPDFAELRAKRNAALHDLYLAVCAKNGWEPSQVSYTASPSGCYCACPDGPCEHEFSGWRAFECDSGAGGGEQVCAKCGCGAMAHDMRCDP